MITFDDALIVASGSGKHWSPAMRGVMFDEASDSSRVCCTYRGFIIATIHKRGIYGVYAPPKLTPALRSRIEFISGVVLYKVSRVRGLIYASRPGLIAERIKFGEMRYVSSSGNWSLRPPADPEIANVTLTEKGELLWNEIVYGHDNELPIETRMKYPLSNHDVALSSNARDAWLVS